MILSHPSKTFCALTLALSLVYVLLALAFQGINLGLLGSILLVMIVCIAEFSSDGTCEPRARVKLTLITTLAILASSSYPQILPYSLLILYPLTLYLAMEDGSYTLLAAITLLFAVTMVFSDYLFLFGRDTPHHAMWVIGIMREGRLTHVKFVDRSYRYFPLYHLLHVELSEVTRIPPTSPFIFSFITYGILGLLLLPHILSKAIGKGSLIPGLLLIGLPLTFISVISPIPQAYSIVLCLLFLLMFLRSPQGRKFTALSSLLVLASFLYHPVPTIIFLILSLFLSMRIHVSESKKPVILISMFLAALTLLLHLQGILRRLISPLMRLATPSVIRDILALKLVAYSVDLSNPVNSFLLTVNYALLLALAMLSLRKRDKTIIFLSSLLFIVSGAALSLIFYTTAFYRYFGVPALFLLAILAGQGLKKLSCKNMGRLLAPLLIVIFASSYVIGALIPPGQPLSQETAYLYKGIPNKPDLVVSSFLGRHASRGVYADYRIEPAVSYYMMIYGKGFWIGIFTPRKADPNLLDRTTGRGVTILRSKALLEMSISPDKRSIDRLVVKRNVCYSVGRTFVTFP